MIKIFVVGTDADGEEELDPFNRVVWREVEVAKLGSITRPNRSIKRIKIISE